MPIKNIFAGTIDVASQALNVRMEKQGLIQSNLANIETPGYMVQDLDFGKVMDHVLTGQGKLARTHQKHIALDPVDAGESFQFSSEKRPVDLDEEMLKLSENQLMYQVATRIVSKKFEGLKYAIDEGGK
ncbi:MAG: flagellar basal body rod protein FlgB [Desulfobulbaceae bacterium]|nr:flagellar basal body rod protein FlgB [Desulfobulbaceae bacterium]MCK5340901.1 flagellar basal body rod protein FlgB [Desulfobulbaceae bacterium]